VSEVFGLPAGGEEHLVGLHPVAVFEGQGDPPRSAPRVHGGHGGVDAHVHPGLGQSAAHHFPGEGLHAGQQAVGLGEQGDGRAQTGPGASHFHPDSAATYDGQSCGHNQVVDVFG
jgi:hypothetical protein